MSERPLRSVDRSRPRRDRPQYPLHWMAFAGLVAVVVGVLVAAQLGVRGAERLDKASLCPKAGPTAMTVVVVDATDPLSAIQRLTVLQRLKKLNGKLQKGELIAIFQVSPNSDNLTPVFSMCRPTKPEEVNELTGSPRRAQERFDGAFVPALDRALQTTMSQSPSDRSPVMEAIQGAAVAGFQRLEAEQSGDAPLRKRMIVVSDMLQHSAMADHYGEPPDFSAFRRTRGYAATRSDLSDVEVVVLYLRRDVARDTQGLRHERFWEQWFQDQNATVERITPIEG